LAQRVWLGIGPSNGLDTGNDRCQRICGRQGAMNHGECLAVVTSDSNLDPSHSLFVEHHTGNFESADFAPDTTMLDHDIDARIEEQRRYLAGSARWLNRNRRLGHRCGYQLAALCFPHPRSISEKRYPPGDDRRINGIVDHQME
jgi:hypothetical protein